MLTRTHFEGCSNTSMNDIDARILTELGFSPGECCSIGHVALNRHAVYDTGHEIIKLYGIDEGVRAMARAEAQAKYAELAIERGVPAPRTLQMGRASDGRPYTILERLEGEVLDDHGDESLWRQIGTLLARLHRPEVKQGLNWRDTWIADLRRSICAACDTPLSLEERNTLMSSFTHICDEASDERFLMLPFGISHGDFSPRNILASNGRITGFIDFELAFVGNVELELARLREMISGRAFNWFLAAYVSENPLPPGFVYRLPVYLAGESILACGWTHACVPEAFGERINRLNSYLGGFL